MTSFDLSEKETLILVIAPVWFQLSLYIIFTVLQSFSGDDNLDKDKILLPFQRIIWYLNGSSIGFEAIYTFFVLYNFFGVKNILPWEISAIVLTSYKYLLDIFIVVIVFNSCSGFRGQRYSLLLSCICFLLYPIGGSITLVKAGGDSNLEDVYDNRLQVTVGVFHAFQAVLYTVLLAGTLYKDNIFWLFFSWRISPHPRRRNMQLYLVNECGISLLKSTFVFLIRYNIAVSPMVYTYSAINWYAYAVKVPLLYLTLGWDAEYWRNQNRSMHRSLSGILERSKSHFQITSADLNEPLLGTRPDETTLMTGNSQNRESPASSLVEEQQLSSRISDSTKTETNVFVSTTDFYLPNIPFYYQNAMFWFLPGVLGLRATRGHSAYARVFRGSFRRKEVAIRKQFCENLDHDVIARFRTEILMWRKLVHRNVVRCLGGSIEPPNLFIITELCERGSLLSLLNKYPNLDWLQKCRYALDVARGLEYLHGLSPSVLHREIRLANIVVSKSGMAKVTDFGSAAIDRTVEGERGSGAAWMAPEVLAASMYSRKSDVYSFGITLWELFTHGVEPYCVQEKFRVRYASRAEVIEAVVTGGLRPYLPIDAPETIMSLMKECWQTDPDKRPDFSRVAEVLEACTLVLKTWYDKHEAAEIDSAATSSTNRSSRRTNEKGAVMD